MPHPAPNANVHLPVARSTGSHRRRAPVARCLAIGAAVSLAAIAVQGCAALDRPALFAACAQVHETATIPVCTALHRQGTALRLPTGSTSHPYGAIGRDHQFVTTAGRRLPVAPAVLDGVSADRSYATTVYRAWVVGGEVRALFPRMTVTPDAIIGHVFGAKVLVGAISPQVGAPDDPSPTYDVHPTLPVVIELADRSAGGSLAGVIRNAQAPVSVGGTCYPALSAAATDPLTGHYTSHVRVERHPAMHMPFDDEFVLVWNDVAGAMGPSLYPSVATVFGRDGLDREGKVAPHGNPVSGPWLRLALTDRSIDPGTC